MDIADIPHIPDHFQQAFVDLGVLKHSLQNEDWTDVFGTDIQTDSFIYTGQSMGSIIGFPWVATQPDIDRAVFNVPGSNLVGLFRDSTYFAPQVSAALDDLDIQPGSYEEVRLFAIALWLIDTIDPHSLARTMRDSEKPALIQMVRSQTPLVMSSFQTTLRKILAASVKSQSNDIRPRPCRPHCSRPRRCHAPRYGCIHRW